MTASIRRRSRPASESASSHCRRDHPAAEGFSLDRWLTFPHILISGRGDTRSALDDQLALVLAVLPAVAVEAIAGADPDVHGEDGLDRHVDVPEAEGALLDEPEETGPARAPLQVVLRAAEVVDAPSADPSNDPV